jgi:hypothetical protein
MTAKDVNSSGSWKGINNYATYLTSLLYICRGITYLLNHFPIKSWGLNLSRKREEANAIGIQLVLEGAEGASMIILPIC